MPTFDTPNLISVTLEVGVGDIRIVASDRTDTVVDVRPSDPAWKPDVTAAELTRVEYADGRLLVEAPKGWRQWSFRAESRSTWRSAAGGIARGRPGRGGGVEP